VSAWEALVRLTLGDVAAAGRWVQDGELRVHDEPTLSYEFMYRALARVLIAQGRSDEALQVLDQLLTMTEAAGATGRAIEILVLQALARQAQGEYDQALTAMERALTLAEPESYVRTFIDEGEPMGQLLRQAAA
jgi:LuxR family maltose regulon positive regulatory protein